LHRTPASVALALWIIAAALPAVARAQTAHETKPSLGTMTPSQWSARADHARRCEAATEPPSDGALALQTWHVDSVDGTIALPRSFTLRQGQRGYRWVGPDSSSISIGGMWALGRPAVSGGKLVAGGVATCAAELFGRKVPAQEFAVVVSSKGDTIFYSIPSTFVTTGQGLQITIQALSAERRARLLEYAESVQLAQSKSPIESPR
jgi:hypothetical protein